MPHPLDRLARRTVRTASTPRRLAPALCLLALWWGCGSEDTGDDGAPGSGDVSTADPVRPLRADALDEQVAELIEGLVQDALEHPEAAAVHAELGMAYAANSLWPEARASFANAVALEPQTPSWLLHLAVATMQDGEFEAAVELLQDLAQRFPSFAPGRHRLGDALMDTADHAAAKGHFQETARLVPHAPEGFLGLARVALAEHDYERAADLLKNKVLVMAPDYGMAHFLLGQAYRGLGREAEAARETALGVDAGKRFLPDPVSARMSRYRTGMVAQIERARIQLERNNPEQAVRILEGANEMRPGRPEILNNLAVAYGTLGQMERVFQVLRESLEADEANALTHISMSLAHLNMGNAQFALKSAQRAIELEPESSRAHFARGTALLMLRRMEEGHEALAEAHRLNPSDPNVRFALGEASFRLRLFDQAELHLRTASEAMPRHVPSRVILGFLYVTLGRLDEAQTTLDEVRELAPDDPDVANLERRLAAERNG